MAKALVCGATGLIGSAVLGILANPTHDLRWAGEEEYPVRAVLYRRGVHAWPYIATVPDFVWADLTKTEDCARICRGIDTVFMCAAITSGAETMVNDPVVHVTENIVMNARMMEAAWRAGVRRFVFVSSATVYQSMGAHPCREADVSLDEWPPHPYRWVGWMKRYSEKLLMTYAEDGKMNIAIVRPTNTYGPRDKFGKGSHMVAALIRRAVEGNDPLEVWGDGTQSRDQIYVDDLAECIVLAARTQGQFLVVNACTGQNVTAAEVAHEVLRTAGSGASIKFLPDKPTTLHSRFLDPAWAKIRLGFEATTPLAEGLRRTVAWYRKVYPCAS